MYNIKTNYGQVGVFTQSIHIVYKKRTRARDKGSGGGELVECVHVK